VLPLLLSSDTAFLFSIFLYIFAAFRAFKAMEILNSISHFNLINYYSRIKC
jgi:hypothetical protein